MCVRQSKGTVSASGARFGRALPPQGRGGFVTDPEQDAQAPVHLGSADPGDVAAAFSPRPNAVPHFSPAERVARGRAARVELPRSVHAGWEPAPLRRDPVELLEQQARTRLPELIAIRYGRMIESPFAFYRGGAYLMASDLAGGPRTGLHAQLCGDAHLSNFGVFASPDRRLVFSINDFDETLPGPFEWDVKRLAASFAVAGREFGYDEADAACDGDGSGPGVSPGDGELCNDADGRRLVHAPRRGQHHRQIQLEGFAEEDEAAPERDRAYPNQGQPPCASRSSAPQSTVSSDL